MKRIAILVPFQEHHVVDWKIRDLPGCLNGAFIGKNVRFLDVVIVVRNKRVQCAVDGVILSGFDFDRNGGKTVVIVDQIVYLAFGTVVVVEQFVPVRDQFACDDRFVHRAEIDTLFVVHNRTNIVAVQDTGQQPDVVQI